MTYLETAAKGAVHLHGTSDYAVGEIVIDHFVRPLRICQNQDLRDFMIWQDWGIFIAEWFQS